MTRYVISYCANGHTHFTAFFDNLEDAKEMQGNLLNNGYELVIIYAGKMNKVGEYKMFPVKED